MREPPFLRPTSTHRGFTLLEALVVIGIVSVLVAAGYPAFNDLRQRREVGAKVSMLNSAIRRAKVEAVRRGRPVTLCPSSNTTDNLPVCGNAASNWAQGWVVFVDDGATRGVIDANETIILVQTPFSGTGTITNNNVAAMNFQATGLPMPPVQSTFTFTGDGSSGANPKYTKTMILSAQGRVTIP